MTMDKPVRIPPPISGGAIAPLLPLFLPLIPGLMEAIIDAVEKFSAKPGTPEENKVALAQVIVECREIDAQVQASPRPGDEVPPA